MFDFKGSVQAGLPNSSLTTFPRWDIRKEKVEAIHTCKQVKGEKKKKKEKLLTFELSYLTSAIHPLNGEIIFSEHCTTGIFRV